MIYIVNKSKSISYLEIFELCSAFLPEEKFHESLDENVPNAIIIEEENGEFIATLKSADGSIVSCSERTIDTGEALSKASLFRLTTKKSIYCLMNKLTGKILPWGVLTGMRPIKLVSSYISKGIPNGEIYKLLKSFYLISDEKAMQALNIAMTQSPFLESFKRNTYSLYLSIPFCPTRCSYCSFPSLSYNTYRDNIKEYVDKLLFELENIKISLSNWNLSSLYIGGGTPTTLPKNEMVRILNYINKNFGSISELTVEAGRPDTLDAEYLLLLKENGVNRISINPQTMNDETLRQVGRNHTARDIIDIFEKARIAEIQSINMDLIAGLPGESTKEMNHTLKVLSELDPDNLTVHTLSIKRGSNLKMNSENLSESSEDINSMLSMAEKFAVGAGLKPYYLYRQKHIMGNHENVGYSRPGMECIYNIAIMEEKQTIIGLGMGAASKFYNKYLDRHIRYANFKDFKNYMTRIDEQIGHKREYLLEIEKSWPSVLT